MNEIHKSINNNGFGTMESTIRGREEDAASAKMQMSVFINKEFQKSQLFLKSVGV